MSEYKSLNLETGMLEDIEEVRKLGVDLAETLRTILQSPFIQLFSPPELLRNTITFATKAESMLRFMSQREQYRLMTRASGVPEETADQVEAMVGELSDTLPATHPQIREKLLRGVLENPDFTDRVKQEALEAYQAGGKQMSELQAPPLSPQIENFLRGLGEDKNKEG